MKRKDFFKKLGIGLVAVVATPRVPEAIPPATEEDKEGYLLNWKVLDEPKYANGWHIPSGKDTEVLNNSFVWNVKYFNGVDWKINDTINIEGMSYLCHSKEENKTQVVYTFIPLGRKDGSDPIIKMHYLKIEVCYD